jgi:hypothetical protein
MIQKADGLEELASLHFGPGDSSIFLREAYTSQFVAAGARVRAAPFRTTPSRKELCARIRYFHIRDVMSPLLIRTFSQT